MTEKDKEASAPGRPLIVINESDPDLRDLLAHVLKKEGYKVAVGEDGLKAVQLATTLVPDLLVFNIGMPEIHGGIAYKAIRENPRTRNIKLLVLTGNDAQEFCPGVDANLAKPIEIIMFLKLVRDLVGPPNAGTGPTDE